MIFDPLEDNRRPVTLADLRGRQRFVRKNLPPDPALIHQARELYLADIPVQDIAATVGRSEGAIGQWARKYGWPLRRSQEPRSANGPTEWRCCGDRQPVGPCRRCGTLPPWLAPEPDLRDLRRGR